MERACHIQMFHVTAVNEPFHSECDVFSTVQCTEIISPLLLNLHVDFRQSL